MLRGLAHIEMDLDSDPGPWPRADEDASARSQSWGALVCGSALILPARMELT